MSASLQLMRITGYTDEEFSKPFSGGPYIFMLNPEGLKIGRTIEYNSEQPPDTSTDSPKYKSTPGDSLSFDMVIDCTGVVDGKRTDMSKEISKLENIIYTYNGDIHRPNYVKIQWGKNTMFKGVLKSFDISYSLFKPDGSPLRAKISLSFSQYISTTTVKKLDKSTSPDISHLVTVVDGITLPQLCLNVWNDDAYYIQVARFNHLNKFRDLKNITKLQFPPIIQLS